MSSAITTRILEVLKCLRVREVFSSTSEASSIWQLTQNSLQTLIANNDEPEESRRGRAEVVIAAPAWESIMEDTRHVPLCILPLPMALMLIHSDLCLIMLIYNISAVDY